jgi:hypothetical protein
MEGEAGRIGEAAAWLRRSRTTLDAARVLAREGYRQASDYVVDIEPEAGLVTRRLEQADALIDVATSLLPGWQD